MCFLLDHANSNSVFSGLSLFELKTVSLEFAPSSFTIRCFELFSVSTDSSKEEVPTKSTNADNFLVVTSLRRK